PRKLKDRAYPHMAVVLAVLFCGLTAAPALALNSIAVGPLSLNAHFNTVHLRLPYTGDDNRNATVLVRYSRGRTFSASGADTAVVPFRDVKIKRFTGVA